MVTKKLMSACGKEVNQDVTVKQGLSLYVPLDASNYPVVDLENSKHRLFSLQSEVVSFLKSENILLLLQGNSGSGKSLFGRHLEKYLWDKRSHHNKIPVFISLPRVCGDKFKRDLIQECFNNKGFDESVISLMKQKLSEKFVFFFDGFDEIKVKYDDNNSEITNNFYNRFKLNSWSGSKFIVSCRSHVLSDKESRDIFDVDMKQPLQIHLAPFSNVKRDNYIEMFVKLGFSLDNGWNANDYKTALNNFKNLREMIKEPFSLLIILNALPKLSEKFKKSDEISRYNIYTAFSDHWFENEVKRLQKILKYSIQK